MRLTGKWVLLWPDHFM